MAGVDTPATRLRVLQRDGCSPDRAWALFDSLPAVRIEEITIGRWRGEELDTGHPWSGALAGSGWYGKQFDSVDAVHPLLFAGRDGVVFPVDPRRVPIRLAGRVPSAGVRAARALLPLLRPLLRSRAPRARLRAIEFRGRISAAMIYDHLPIVDLFRLVDDETLLGVMDLRGPAEPYFFVLRRERP